MPIWWVSEPKINLRLEDRPLGYRPGRGLPVVFHLSYRQRGTLPADNAIFGLGTNWSCSFKSFLVVKGSYLDAPTIMQHDGGAEYRMYEGLGNPNYLNGYNVTTADGATWYVNHPDGSYDVYGDLFTNYLGDVMVFLSERVDAHGQALTFNYSYTGGGTALRLNSVTDADGRSTTIAYNSDPVFSNRIDHVTDPFGRTCYLTYSQTTGCLTNVTDVQGIPSGFTYGTYGISDLITPYGTTSFEHGGLAVSNPDYFSSSGGVNRYTRVTQPDGGHQLYLYRQVCWDLVPDTFAANPITSPVTNNFEVEYLDEADSFHWDARQYAALSTTTVDSLTAGDYALARQRHWLYDSFYGGISQVLSLERAPSPDGTTPGQATWYDYAGKTEPHYSGLSAMPLTVARVLPNGETSFLYTERNLYQHVTRSIQTYTKTDGTVDLRTSHFYYAGNALDLQQQVGPTGAQVVSNYFNNAYHQPDASYDALNQETKYTYNGDRQLTSVKTPAGLTTTNVYLTSGTYAGWLEKTIDLEIKRTNSFTYQNGLTDSHTDERGLTITNFYDNLLRLTGVRFPDATTTSNRYTYLDLTARKDRLGYWSYSGYDAMRRPVAHTNANGVVTRYGFCSCGAVDSVTNAWSTAVQTVTSYTYDYQGNRRIVHLPDLIVTNWFDSLRRLTLATADDATTNWFGYNNQGLRIGVTNGLGVASQFTVYDIEDRPIYVTDENGVTVTNTYDDLDRLRTRTYPDAGVEKFGYSARGLIAYTNQLGFTNFYAYDEAGRKTFETNANWELIRYTNNAAGDLLALVDGKGQVTKWNYDEFGRVTNKLDQAATVILKYTYDADSRLSNRWSVAKGTTIYSYDPVGNLTNINYPASTDVSFAYDALNRVTNMVDAAGTTLYGYAVGGQLWTEDGPWSSDTVTNTYANRLRTKLNLAQPTGQWTNLFGYDAAKRLTTVTSPAGSFGYTFAGPASRLTQKLSLPNTSYITNAYDNVARLRFTKLKNSSHTTLDAADYGYNASHQRITFTNTAGTWVTNSYDLIGQLKIANSSVNSEDRGYTYDAAWNLNYRTNNGTTSYFNVNSLNELTTTSLGSALYDGNGNLTNSHSGARSYVYDDENRLVELYVGQNENATEFVYDGLGRLRIRREYTYDTGGGEESLTAPGGLSAATSQSLGGGQSSLTVGGSWTLVSETHYVYDGWRVIQERDGSNVPTASYTRGTDLSGSLEGAGGIGGLLARSYGYAGGNWSTHTYYHADGNGNVTYLVNSSQTQAAFYRYDPFGNLIDSSDNLTSPNPYRFSSKEVHLTSGLYYYGYRFYDPQNQRWQNRDPLGELGGLNLFAYCYNDPIRYYDAFGLDIEVDPKDKADYDAAKKKLCKDPKMAAEFHVMEHAKKKVILKTNSSDDDSVTRGPGKPDIINWDPRSALKTKDGGKQSPALGLGHEVAHANKNKWDSTSDPNYGNAEERRVIQGPEASTAKTLGEDGRKDHEGTTYHVPSPTKR